MRCRILQGVTAVTPDAAASGIRMQEGFHSQASRSEGDADADLKAEGGADFLPADASQRSAGGEDRSGGGGDRGRGKSRRPNEMQELTGRCRLCRK